MLRRRPTPLHAVWLVALLASCGDAPSPSSPAPAPVAIVPRPAALEVESDAAPFILDDRVAVIVEPDEEAVRAVGEHLVELLRPALPGIGSPRPSSGGRVPSRAVLLTMQDADPSLGDEGYELEVTSGAIAVRAPAARGLFYGIQSLRQLLPATIEGPSPSAVERIAVPALRIVDRPRFGWRGFMLDVSRTFLRKEFLFRMVDLLALYKLNVLHLHLSDDQGWRVESESHPELHRVGSSFDAATHPDEVDGYYTKQELRELVAYAAERYIRVVPEIDMPGHVVAMLRAIPELACRVAEDQPRSADEFAIVPYWDGPFVHEEVLCACDDRIYATLFDVLDEIIELFPGEYVHVGGDEAPTAEWESSYLCAERIASGELAGIRQVQATFSKRIEDHLRSRGRKMIGWTEVLTTEAEGGPSFRLSGDFTTMHWRAFLPEPGGLYDRPVIQSPAFAFYLDWYRATPLAGVYAYDPVPEGLSAEQEARVLGAQGNMWTGFPQNRSEERVDWHVFPKLLAIAEVVWTPRELRSWDDFQARQPLHDERLERLGVALGICPDCVL